MENEQKKLVDIVRNWVNVDNQLSKLNLTLYFLFFSHFTFEIIFFF